MEQHISGCPACAARLETYAKLSRPVSCGAAENDAAMEAAKARVWENLSRMETAARTEERRHVPVWQRSIPLPAAVAAMLVIAFIAVMAGGPARARQIPDANAAMASVSADAPGIIPASSMAGVLQYLETQESGTDIVIIRLPESRNFMSYGEPTLIRAADYSGRTITP
ncbi:hypothetical protein [Breznakiella homolactica]|nr:hypothetical protein [Breznakiella homolactica]